MPTRLPLSPEEYAHASNLVGRGLFSALRLAKEQQSPISFDEDKADAETLKIPIPLHLLQQAAAQKHAEEKQASDAYVDRSLSFHRHPLTAVLGAQGGFRDARKEFFDQQKASYQKELQEAQREYIETLSRIKQGSDAATPHVDAFCTGMVAIAMAEEASYEKQANDDVPAIEEGALLRFLKERAHSVFGPVVDPIKNLATKSVRDLGIGTAGLTYMAQRNKSQNPDAFLQERTPLRVELDPYGA